MMPEQAPVDLYAATGSSPPDVGGSPRCSPAEVFAAERASNVFDLSSVMARAAADAGLGEIDERPLVQRSSVGSLVTHMADARRGSMPVAPDALLDVDAVRMRYGGCGPRAARDAMHRAGAVRVAGKMWVHHDVLVEYERGITKRELPVERSARTVNGTRRARTSSEGIDVAGDDWYLEA